MHANRSHHITITVLYILVLHVCWAYMCTHCPSVLLSSPNTKLPACSWGAWVNWPLVFFAILFCVIHIICVVDVLLLPCLMCYIRLWQGSNNTWTGIVFLVSVIIWVCNYWSGFRAKGYKIARSYIIGSKIPKIYPTAVKQLSSWSRDWARSNRYDPQRNMHGQKQLVGGFVYIRRYAKRSQPCSQA